MNLGSYYSGPGRMEENAGLDMGGNFTGSMRLTESMVVKHEIKIF